MWNILLLFLFICCEKSILFRIRNRIRFKHIHSAVLMWEIIWRDFEVFIVCLVYSTNGSNDTFLNWNSWLLSHSLNALTRNCLLFLFDALFCFSLSVFIFPVIFPLLLLFFTILCFMWKWKFVISTISCFVYLSNWIIKRNLLFVVVVRIQPFSYRNVKCVSMLFICKYHFLPFL